MQYPSRPPTGGGGGYPPQQQPPQLQQQQPPPGAPGYGGGGFAPPPGGAPSFALPPQQQQQQPSPAAPPQPRAAPPPAQAQPSPQPPQGAAYRPQQVAPAPSKAPSEKSKATNEGIIVPRSLDEETEDGRIRNREAVMKIRDAWIYKKIRARQDEFTQYRKARLLLGTWNVNAKGKDEALDDWLCRDWGKDQAPDIVAVGFQEIVDLNAVNVAVDNKSQQKSSQWVDRIRATLNSPQHTHNDPARRGYTLLAQRYLVGLMVCVFVQNQHYGRVKFVHTDSVGVGVMGMMGNKGGVSIRLQFYDSTICITNSHLAAHRENVTGRNADFANIFSRTSFDIGDEAVKEVIRSGSLSQWATGSSSVGIADHDLAFWIGDLNYRLEEGLGAETIMNMANTGQLDELRSIDQLNVERAQGRVFQGWEEGFLNFKPTYKYEPGTDQYDARPEKKLRAPAWCDRVLWMAQNPQHVQQLNYQRSELKISDHKPVMSSFVITIKDVIPNKREAVYEELIKLLDKHENQSLPMVGLDRLRIDFGQVRYEQKITLPIKVTNTGSVVAQFRLAPKLDEVTLCKQWLTVSPTYGMLIPGEKEATIQFTISIDNATARALNSGQEVLEDIVILRLENGRDYYITITAQYARSCFGMSVDELVMHSEPIRMVPLDPLQRAEWKGGDSPTAMTTSATSSSSAAAALCVPKELWRVVDAIYERGLGERELFVTPGLANEVSQIRECLDTGTAFESHCLVHSFSQVLIEFLSNLSTPIVPSGLVPQLEIDAQNIQSCARRFLEELPPIHYNVFVYMISFFREVLLYRETNKLSALKLARLCCSTLVQLEETSATAISKRAGLQLIMLHFLETSLI